MRLMPPVYVKPYVKRGKNDVADAEAICEAVTRPTMRFVAIKSREQQAALSLHRARSLLIRQRTQLVNLMRSMLAELGVRRQNICRNVRLKLAEVRPRLGFDIRRRACGVASADVRWSVA